VNDERPPKGPHEPATKLAEATIRRPGTDGLIVDTQRLLAVARDYASRGWPVFPCLPGSKAPATVHGFKDATTDPDVIRAWWSRMPTANVAIATGRPGPDVLDVDIKPTGTGWPAFNRLKRAGRLAGASVLVSTRNGGLHAYYAGTRQASGSLRSLLLDFKATGGYVLAPPSVVPADEHAPQGTGRYELLDERDGTACLDWAACRALLDPPRRTPAYVPPHQGSVQALADWLTRQPDGNRNNALFWAACRGVENGNDLDILRDAVVAAGLPEAEARRTIASAMRTIGGAA
jgi:hypothetical protein